MQRREIQPTPAVSSLVSRSSFEETYQHLGKKGQGRGGKATAQVNLGRVPYSYIAGGTGTSFASF